MFNYQTTNKLDLVSRNYSSEFQTDTAIKKQGDLLEINEKLAKRVNIKD